MKWRLRLNWQKLEGLTSGISLKAGLLVVSASFGIATVGSFVAVMVMKPDYGTHSSKKSGSNQDEELPVFPPQTSQEKQPMPAAKLQVILDRNLFNREGTLGDSELNEGGKKEEPDEQDKILATKLPLQLMGVIFGGKPNVGLALIENKEKKRTTSYLVGDNVFKGAILREVYETRVILENNGRREYLALVVKEIQRSTRNRKSKPVSADPTLRPLATGPVAETFKEEGFERHGMTIQLTGQYKENLLGPQFSQVLQDAKAEPNMVGGELMGFKLTRIRESSIWQKAGFQSGDIVHEINGIPLRDAASAIKLLQSLRNEAAEIEVRVQRGNDFSNMNISIQ